MCVAEDPVGADATPGFGPGWYEANADRLGYGPRTAALDPERLAYLERWVTGSVLDVGCGTGLYVDALARTGHDAHGVDFAPALLDAARRRGRGTFYLGRAERLPFGDLSFDTVLALDVLEHVADDGAVLGELARVARDRVLVVVPARTPDDLRRTGLVFRPDEDPSHRRTYDAPDLTRRLDAAGLEPLAVEGVGRVDVNGFLLRTIRFERRGVSRLFFRFLFKALRYARVRREPTGWLAVARPRPTRAAPPRRALATVLALAALLLGACARTSIPPPLAPAEAPRAVADPYAHGPYGAATEKVAWGTAGAPATLRVHRPVRGEGPWPVVVLLHGFGASDASYDDVARHLASHGFVVVLPQMYEPGPLALVHVPTVDAEATVAERVLAWLEDGLPVAAHVQVDRARTGLAGHSRGGRVAWRLVRADPHAVRAVALLDPVDGGSGLVRHARPDADRPNPYAGPVLVLGAGVGGRCAPADRNHDRFAASAGPRALHLLVPGMGHVDFLDEAAARRAALLCGGGPNRGSSRRLVGGLLVAFFGSTLANRPDLAAALSSPAAAPRPFVVLSAR